MTLLALVLAIGLVVDDAIVVLENIQRHIDNGLSPLEAAIHGSREISFEIVAMTLTLASIHIHMAFFITGAIGELFIEFAVALAGSVLISGYSLTLSHH
ncbi:Multidrug resistance protein MdtB [Hyalomma marginatum]|uniref:Multidrug resistance protein MdtB n=1 Tax=Hyalomma marginatum TaxID=34627 RepID=A0A8S4C0Y2_9ACAR|nr:Multidrug resistance protein MdtB [Hyalomma marginatum]CAG7592914.1 Multidrug resistance protein MdtB [Hyalomma marginatum]